MNWQRLGGRSDFGGGAGQKKHEIRTNRLSVGRRQGLTSKPSAGVAVEGESERE